MIRFLLRFGKGFLICFLILVISVAVGVAYYALTSGGGSALKDHAETVIEQGKARGVEDGLIERSSAFFQQVVDALTTKTTPAEAAAARIPPPQDQGEVRVYFAPCQRLNPFGIDDAFLDFLSGARKSIYGAFYELQWPEAAEVLIAKHQAGVDVRLVSDSDYRDRDAIQRCMRAGIPVVFDERKALMHNKFCVVDGKSVWSGSTNITENCLYRNDNNSVLITSEKLAEDYATEFDEMFLHRRFGKKSAERTPYPEVVVGHVQIECYFAPEDHVERKIIDEIQVAEKSIDAMVFTFTSDSIAQALAAKVQKGARVRVLFDRRQAGLKDSEDEYLRGQGSQVFMDQNEYAMHNKVMILDTTTVLTGSYNFTKAADTENDENLLVIHSPAIAERYERVFESLLPN